MLVSCKCFLFYCFEMKLVLLSYVSLACLLFSCKTITKPTDVSQFRQKLIFSDEFNSEVLNSEFWQFDLGDGCPDLCGWGNQELEHYTENNHKLEDGKLIITASLEADSSFHSTRIKSKDKFEFTYGFIEMRAKLPQGKGVWPAFWLLGANIDEVGWPKCGEIDVMEFAGKDSDKIHTTLHTQESHGQSVNTKIHTLENLSTEFHTYAANWTEDYIDFYIDEQLVYQFTPTDLSDEDSWPFHHDFFILLNFAVGGSFAGHEIDYNAFPQQYVVDYVKVWQTK